MDQGICDMLRGALASAERGEIVALAIVAAAPGEKPMIGYLERDQSAAIAMGLAALHYHLAVEPRCEDDSEYPARSLRQL